MIQCRVNNQFYTSEYFNPPIASLSKLTFKFYEPNGKLFNFKHQIEGQSDNMIFTGALVNNGGGYSIGHTTAIVINNTDYTLLQNLKRNDIIYKFDTNAICKNWYNNKNLYK